MHMSKFIFPVALLAVVSGLPVPQSIDSTPSSTLDSATGSSPTTAATDISQSLAATNLATDSIAATTTDSLPPLPTDSTVDSDAGLPTAADSSSSNATDTSILPTVTDSSSLDATATDSSVFTSVSEALSSTLSPDASLPTATATDISSTDSVNAPLASATANAISFDVPVVPSACAALSSPLPLPSSFTALSPVATDDGASSLASTLGSGTPTAVPSASSSTSPAPSSAISSVGNSTASASIGANAVSSSIANATNSVALQSVTATDSAALPIITDGSETSTDNSTLIRRIAQADLPDVAQSWQDLCLVSGGDIFTNEPCVQLAGINGINALLANADPCAQQDNADAMIDFANSPGVTNSQDLIANAIAYMQHPRNALNINGIIPSTPYCQRAPRNSELQGLVSAQLDGVNPGIFGGPTFGLVAFGDPSSCPFGSTPDVTTCSCS